MRRVAFVAGSNGPSAIGMDNLKYVTNDITKISHVLSQAIAGYSVECAQDCSGPGEVISKFEQIASGCGHGDTLLFYFSGHGYLLRGQLFLVWNSTDLSKPVTTAVPVSNLKTILANTRAKVKLMILDCCHSGAAGEKTFAKSGLSTIGEPLIEAAKESASIILSACGRSAVAREVPEFESGYLTHYLVEALSNRFDEAVRDHDGLLSLQDFIGWCSEETTRYNRTRVAEELLECPEVYGDFRSDVFLTTYRVLRDGGFNERLSRRLFESVEKVRRAFEAHKNEVNFQLADKLASPFRQIASTITDLKLLDQLFLSGDDASIFAAAVILRIRQVFDSSPAILAVSPFAMERQLYSLATHGATS